MKAKNITGQPPGGKRTPISELLPLDTPLLMQIFPIYRCNFRCKYCTFSIDKDKRGFISDKEIFPLDLFKRIINDSVYFPSKIRVLRFVGMGEPLLHPDILEMIAHAKDSNKFERIELLTNGSLLTQKISDSLISAGLTKLLISIQGTSKEKYKEISGVNLNFNDFINNIRYIYDNRKQCQIHIKIIDCALDGIDDEMWFFELFGDICDTIGIEKAGPIYPDVAYNKEIPTGDINQYNCEAGNSNICTQPFFSIQINPDGNVVPCYSIDYPKIMGNINTEYIVNIWNGKIYNQFRHDMLSGISCNNICENCLIFRHRSYQEDTLNDKKIQELKECYKR